MLLWSQLSLSLLLFIHWLAGVQLQEVMFVRCVVFFFLELLYFSRRQLFQAAELLLVPLPCFPSSRIVFYSVRPAGQPAKPPDWLADSQLSSVSWSISQP